MREHSGDRDGSGRPARAPLIDWEKRKTVTYDHRYRKIRDPVRSPIDKPVIVRLVLGWVTTGESLMLYVFFLPSLGQRGPWWATMWMGSSSFQVAH